MYAILAALLFGATPGDAGPLTAPAPSADRDEVRTGPPLTQTFELTNTDPVAAVTITGVETTCGCLKPKVSREVLRPGEKTELTLTVNTLTQPAGHNVWRMTVRYRVAQPTADPTPPSVAPDRALELKLSATLVREVSVTPPMLAISTSGEVTQTVTVSDLRSAPLTVQSAATTNPHLKATVRPATAEGGVRTQAVDLTVTAAFPPGQSDETLVLLTSDPACRELRVPVRVTKRTPGAVVATPEGLDVRFARGQAEASALVQLRRPGGGAVRVERVECDHPGVRARWAAATGPVATVRVVVDLEKAGGRAGRADVRVILAEPAGETVVVPAAWSAPAGGG